MTKSGSILWVIAALALLLAIAWGFNYYNDEKQETRQQAIESLDRGIMLFRERKFAESLEVLQGIPKGVIQDWHLQYYTASAHVMLKDYQAAAPILEEALALNPQEPLILFELGVVYFKLGNLSLSKAYFAAVVEIDPTHEEARGLMNIMANLERQQPGANSEEALKDENTGVEDH